MGSLWKAAPVGFVVGVMLTVFFTYVSAHISPRLRPEIEADALLPLFAGSSGVWLELGVFMGLVGMLLINFAAAVMTDPGGVPQSKKWEWPSAYENQESQVSGDVQETKRDGQRRKCTKCFLLKPDRSHHCRVCDRCVLKMDHHCPWIANCVGYRNYKYFFLLVWYSALTCWWTFLTMGPTIARLMTDAEAAAETPFVALFFLLFSEALVLFLGILTTGFGTFHIFLIASARTTIEYCEKQSFALRSVYDVGVFGNLRAALGSNPLLWGLPLALPVDGDGTQFIHEGTQLSRDPEASLPIRRKGHKPATERFPLSTAAASQTQTAE
jgi:hypothetical protein